jgi:hypothetical protein
MINYDLDAMFMYTVTMGVVGLLMAWDAIIIALKGWAVRKKRRTCFAWTDEASDGLWTTMIVLRGTARRSHYERKVSVC